MLSFITVALVVVSLHSNKTLTKKSAMRCYGQGKDALPHPLPSPPAVGGRAGPAPHLQQHSEEWTLHLIWPAPQGMQKHIKPSSRMTKLVGECRSHHLRLHQPLCSSFSSYSLEHP